MDRTKVDAIAVEVWRQLLESVTEEMGATLQRTAYSPNIKERLDHSCALFDTQGLMVAQAAHIPVHLGAMPLMMERLRSEVTWAPGSMWLCNDPRHGGTHLPDLTLVAPIYLPGAGRARTLIGFAANRAHHADIGGIAPGSLPLSTELFQEGFIVPPVRLVANGRIQRDVMALLGANSRTGEERRGDLAAQAAANQIGIRRYVELFERYGAEEVARRHEEARRHTRAQIEAALRTAADGDYEFTDWMDDDGAGRRDLPIHVTARIRRGTVEFDFEGTASETAGSINAPEAVTRSACYYVIRCLVNDEIAMNAGAFEKVGVRAPEGTIVNPRFPRAVAAGNVETSQRIVDALLGALAPAFPDRIPAGSQGTMNNLLIGGDDPHRGRRYSYYETICGGAGAGPLRSGASAVHTHMTNTRNTPIEALELHYPLRVRRYSLRARSGGAGAASGGDGVIREIELLAPAHVSVVSERRLRPPRGARGGSDGEPGRNRIAPPGGDATEAAAKFSRPLETGTVVTIETPGGGGFGR